MDSLQQQKIHSKKPVREWGGGRVGAEGVGAREGVVKIT